MKYIPAEKLIAEVKRLRPRIRRIGGKDVFVTTDSVYKKLDCIIDFARSLQQEHPEVDLEKEYKEFVESDPVYSKLVNGIVGKAIARHFYELGKARKEE